MKLVDVLWAGLQDSYVNMPMAITAEKLGGMYDITREQCDEFALTGQQRWANGEWGEGGERERGRERRDEAVVLVTCLFFVVFF